MKKLLAVLASGFLFSAVSFAQDAFEENAAEQKVCSASFVNTFNTPRHDGMDSFEDFAEHFVERGYVWQDCIKPVLDTKKDSYVVLTSYINGAKPTASEIDRTVLSAVELYEELEDYIEDYQERSRQYERPERFMKIDLGGYQTQNQYILRKYKNETKYFKPKSKDPKIIIEIKYEKAPAKNKVGEVEVLVK
ncbi:MAG: hypothetical protein LBM71_01345 [Elusimicrobiota bacterium]|jgi:hypothetical protein|nr:hypothetical protein [Elusimicrobiota bacterium]